MTVKLGLDPATFGGHTFLVTSVNTIRSAMGYVTGVAGYTSPMLLALLVGS
jgi:hypothetical protein